MRWNVKTAVSCDARVLRVIENRGVLLWWCAYSAGTWHLQSSLTVARLGRYRMVRINGQANNEYGWINVSPTAVTQLLCAGGLYRLVGGIKSVGGAGGRSIQLHGG